ncbi:MAG TPA: response regulator, partial [Deltaproteobacteria bacterium]|nr:response regulator [Deltaproteobacteria bacterium]
MYPKNTILLIDDDTSLHDLCRAILARMGYKCISAFNGVEGLEKIREHHPDLILLDLMMPDMDGEQVYQELISNAEYQAYKDIPVIMLTAISHDEERENKMLKLGVSAYLDKPFGLNELVNVIKNVFVTHEIRLHNKRLQEEITSAKQYLERLIDNAPVGVLSSDAKGNIVQVNSFFVNLMGVESVDKLWGQNILEGEVIGRKDVCERFRQVLETGTAVKIPTIDIHNRQGRRINVNINCVPLKDENGNISGLLSIWEDVTEAEKRAYELNILRQIGQAMQSVLELDPLLHLILTSITAGCALGFSRAMILLVNEQKKVLEGKMGVGPTSLEEALEIWDKLAKEHSNLEVFLEKYGLKLPNRNDRFDQIVKKVSVPLDQDWDVLIKTIREKRPFKIENAA